jgi:hypothetical protein
LRPGAAFIGAAAATLACGSGPGPAPAAAPVTYQPAPVRIAPGTAHYRSASYIHLEQQVSGQAQQSDEVRVFFFTATLTPRGEALGVTLTVDSIGRYEAGLTALPTEQIRGVTFTGTLAPDGEIQGLTGGDSTVRAVAELADGLSHLYPRVPPRGVEAGAEWTDTAQTISRTGGLPLTVVEVSQHRAELSTGSGPAGAIPIRTSTRYTFSGQGSQGGQAFSVNGEGRRHTLELLGLGGLFHGLTLADTSTFTVSLPALDVTIPGRQTRADTLSLLPE